MSADFGNIDNNKNISLGKRHNKTLSLRKDKDGRIDVPPDLLTQISIELPEALHLTGYQLVFAQSSTGKIVGLVERTPEAPYKIDALVKFSRIKHEFNKLLKLKKGDLNQLSAEAFIEQFLPKEERMSMELNHFRTIYPLYADRLLVLYFNLERILGFNCILAELIKKDLIKLIDYYKDMLISNLERKKSWDQALIDLEVYLKDYKICKWVVKTYEKKKIFLSEGI